MLILMFIVYQHSTGSGRTNVISDPLVAQTWLPPCLAVQPAWMGKGPSESEDSNGELMRVQVHYQCMQLVEPRHQVVMGSYWRSD